ncbi:MAG: serine/threonine-protein kinase [Myxococcota bacterium]
MFTTEGANTGSGAVVEDDLFAGTDYRTVRRLSSGGMGELFVVAHRRTGRQSIAKLPQERWAADARILERLRLEAQSLGRLQHPNVVSILSVGALRDGRPFIIMEYLEGRTLAGELAARRRLGVIEALVLTCDLLSALGAAHKLGIVHRDIKPQNLFVCSDPELGRYLKVFDFGVARILPDAPSGAPEPVAVPTDAGVVIGTPLYVSPEAAVCGAVDPRGDLYSAGLVLYMMLAGRGPFDHFGSDELVLTAHAVEDAPPLSQFTRRPIPAEIERAVQRALHKQPGERFQSADEFRFELLRVIQDLTMPAGWLETTTHAPFEREDPVAESGPRLSDAAMARTREADRATLRISRVTPSDPFQQLKLVVVSTLAFVVMAVAARALIFYLRARP